MTNYLFALLLFFCLFSTTQAQKLQKHWTLETVNGVETNLKFKNFSPTQLATFRVQFVGENEKLLPQFMEQGIDKGIFQGFFLINNELANGQLNGYYPNKKKAFVFHFSNGIRYGQALFYDEKGNVVEINYAPQEHILYENPNNIQLEKPVIYLYPTEKTEISVKLDFDQKQLTHTYPKYNPEKGWNVVAEPNGNLKNVENGKDYYALFWEGQTQKPTEIKQGFVVKGENTAEFLEEKLAVLGLNWRESNEFIMHWLPQMENNRYNLIHFSTEEYSNNYPITITPRPDNFIRVFMVFEPLEKAIEMPTQELKAAKRGGFTVVEWGGAKQEKPKF